MDKPVAYDYDKQEWASGPAAVALIAKQDAEELSCLRQPAYGKMMGWTAAQVAERIRTIEARS